MLFARSVIYRPDFWTAPVDWFDAWLCSHSGTAFAIAALGLSLIVLCLRRARQVARRRATCTNGPDADYREPPEPPVR